MKIFTKFLFCSIFFLSLNFVSLAQKIDSCNVFLKGNYLEVGVNWNGCYGSSIPPPAGYHPDTLSSFYNCSGVLTTGSALGFVADVDKNGWATGTPAYYGDYILPGTHQEGWSVMADGNQVNQWNYHSHDSSVLEGDMSIYFIDYSTNTSGDTVMSTWAGTYGDYIQVTQFTVLDTSKLFFTVHVQIDNTGLSTSNNIYYMRSIKANPDALLTGGSYTTKNKIEHQLPDSLGRSAVSSASTVYANAYLALGSQNPNATCFIIKNAPAPIFNTIDNISAAADTNYLYGVNDSLTNTGGIGIVFNLGSIPSESFDTFSFVYAFTPGALNEAFGTVTTDTTVTHVGVPVVSTAHYAVYPNPFKTGFSISGITPADNVQLYDVLGRNISRQVTTAGSNTFTTENLLPGLYVLLVKDATGAVEWKTPIQKQ